MKGVMMKDLYLNLSTFSNKFGFVFYYLTTILLMMLFQTIIGFVIISLYFIPFIVVPTISQITTHKDDASKYHKFQQITPVTRKEIVNAKYLLGFLFVLFNMFLLFFVMLIYVYVYKSMFIQTGIFILFLSFVFSIFSISIIYFLNNTFNSIVGKTGQSILIIVSLPVGNHFQQYLLKYSYNIEPLTSYLYTALIVVTILFVLSYFNSMKYYLKRDFQ